MQWINLIGNEKFNLNIIKKFEHKGCVRCYDGELKGRYCVDYGFGEYVFYDYVDNCVDNGFEEVLSVIPYVNPKIVTMVYSSKVRVKNVLAQSAYPKDIYVDNDYGIIVPIRQFIKMGMPLDAEETKTALRKLNDNEKEIQVFGD